VIDIGLLRQGKFPIVALDSFTLTSGFQLGGLGVQATLTLGLAPLDADDNLVTDPIDRLDNDIVAKRVLYALIDGSLTIPGGYGARILTAISAAGPLVVLRRGAGADHHRAKFRACHHGPARRHPLRCRFPRHRQPLRPAQSRPSSPPAKSIPPIGRCCSNNRSPPSKKPTKKATCLLGFLSAPMIIELGGSLGSAYLPGISGNMDVMLSTSGKILVSGTIKYALGASKSPSPAPKCSPTSARSPMAARCSCSSATCPANPPCSRSMAHWCSSCWTPPATRSPARRRNPSDVDGFRMVVTGGVEVNLLIDKLQIAGRASITITTELMELDINGLIKLPFLGELEMAGLMIFDFETVELWGAITVRLSGNPVLAALGLEVEAVANLMFNTSDTEAKEVTLFFFDFDLMEKKTEPVSITIPVSSFAIYLIGQMQRPPAVF
jgi:hypothetical protein